ncbi:zinc finger protein 850-like [Littorina saxatilis]|uniref:C2H2-type domain-containing protein n=1 Tax=Littorina saxatilis TaxID=31220 RepID=A0AAN9BYI1_9CAEN
MEGNSRAQYFPPHDSLAAEVLNKLQGNPGFASVALPEGFTFQHIPVSSSTMVSAPAPMLNPSLVASSLGQVSIPSDGVILSSASSLDPALTQLLVAAQSANTGVATHSSASTLISDVVPVLASNMPLNLQPRSMAQNLHPVLSASLAQSNNATAVFLPPDPAPPERLPAPTNSSEAMTITVQCTMSDTVIVVGQQMWQCCMCRDSYGFDVSVDQHLALRHNLLITPPTQHQPAMHMTTSAALGVTSLATSTCSSADANADIKRQMLASSSSLQTISEKSLSLLKAPDCGRSGLEREVALLMAQTFTHAGDGPMLNDDTHTASAASLTSFIPKKDHDSAEGLQSNPRPFPDIADQIKKTDQLADCAASTAEPGTTNVFGNMISKVEKAILSAPNADTRNDLLLVATELARMRKDVSSKRSKMKKKHRYITCPECGKEVRNRKDLIKQHNRCHETAKTFRCLVCNKMFKYAHTLRRHVVQQGHEGGMPAELPGNLSVDADANEGGSGGGGGTGTVSGVTAEAAKPAKSVKAEAEEEEEDEAERFMTISFSPPSPEHRAKSSDSQAGSLDNTVTPSSQSAGDSQYAVGVPAYEKILALLLEKGEKNRTAAGKKVSLLQCFVCDREIRNRNYYISRHARCHLEDLCYTCGVCGLEFYRTDYYKEHMLQHGVKPTSQLSKGKKIPASMKQKGAGKGRKKVWTPKPLTVPCKICGKGIFNRTYNIKRHAQQHSILEWETILGAAPHTDQAQPRPSAAPQRSIRCGMCGMTFKSYTLKRRHMLTHRSSFSCRACGAKFDAVVEMVAHSQTCRKNSSDLGSEGHEEGQQMEGHGLSLLGRRQLSSAGGKKFECPVCKASIINTTQNVKRHMRELHSDGLPHTCSVCGRTYNSYHKLQRHVKSHGDTGGICHVCGKVFQTKSALRSHTKLHASPEGMFQCPQCPKSFRFQGRLEKHLKKHAERADICPHCGKVYISKIHLKRHISVLHLGVKDYRHKCGQCGAQFFESVQLRDHIAFRHHGIQLYQCKYCSKGFNCRPTMVRHERKEHTNYLPYKCNHCTQCFAEKSKLVAHEMTHTGMSPHKCDVCSKFFTTGSALKAHKNLHLGNKPFVCAVCGKTYLKNWHMLQHMRKAHHTLEVVLYDTPPHNAQGQELTQQQQQQQQTLNQGDILPTVDQTCLQGPDTKFLHVPQTMDAKFVHESVPGGEYIHMQAAAGANTIQPRGNLQPVTHNMMQGHTHIAMQPNIVYPQKQEF